MSRRPPPPLPLAARAFGARDLPRLALKSGYGPVVTCGRASGAYYLGSCGRAVYKCWGYAKLKPPAVKATTFGLHSFHHLASNALNKPLPDNTRKADTFSMFKLHQLKQFKNK